MQMNLFEALNNSADCLIYINTCSTFVASLIRTRDEKLDNSKRDKTRTTQELSSFVVYVYTRLSTSYLHCRIIDCILDVP